MKKRFVICFLILTLLLSGCAGHKPDASLEAPPSSSAGDPTVTGSTEPSGTGTTASSDPATDPTDPVATGEPTASDPATATEAPEPSQAPKPTEMPKPTEAPKPKPTEGHTHSYTAQTVAATCTEQGYTLHTCSCGNSYTDSYTSAAGHRYTDTVVAATCSSKGYTLHTCSACGSSYQDNYTERTAHNYGWEGYKVVVPSTCTTHGSATLKCTVCGKEKTFDGVLDTVSHSYVESINSAGQRVYTCSACGGVVNLDYYIQYAKDVAREMGFIVEEVPEGANSEVPGGWHGWDNPDIINPRYADKGYIEQYIHQRLTRYKSRGITSIWVWAQPNPYTDSRSGWYLYIAYG